SLQTGRSAGGVIDGGEIDGGVTDGGASNCSIETVAGFSSDIRLNQIGFYPKAPKTAVTRGNPSGSQFFVKTIDLATTVFTGTIGGAATWNYSNESVRVLNFSPLTTSGTYVLEVPGVGTSYSFRIAEGVHTVVNKAAMKAFYFNRASTAIDAAFGGAYARAAGHPDNTIIVLPSASSGARPAGTILSSPKGWYDAGDYNSYVVNSGISTYTLLSAYEQFKTYYDTLNLNIPESGNTLPDILDEIKWNLDWMLTMQDPNDGGVYNKKSNANFDPWVMPNAATSARYMCAKGTAATFDFAAVMAMAYRIYLPFNPTFANTCLSAATSAYNWGVSNPNIPFNNPGASGGYP
ncbi:MAG: glycoside hydrolase family 9 protein, partial [Cytophagales bacterium]|nr:glycoside hydrolase family 9 protein [Cytophagales bacterium]